MSNYATDLATLLIINSGLNGTRLLTRLYSSQAIKNLEHLNFPRPSVNRDVGTK